MKLFLLSSLLLGLLNNALAQSGSACGCDYTVTKAGRYNNSSLKIQPGQTVCVQAGRYDYLTFVNFVGAPGQPIRFINCGGQVIGTFQIQNSSNFVVSGSGSSTVPYGFLIDAACNALNGLTVGGFSSDYEIERVETGPVSYTGFSLKLDPSCDSTTWRGNYTIRNVSIHDNYVHDTGGPGMFIGSGYSATSGVSFNCSGTPKTVYPVQMEGLRVYNNRIETTTGVGLNINNAPGASVYGNTLVATNLGPMPGGWQKGGPAACGCDYTITQANTFNNNRLGVKPGQTVCLQAGQYNYLRLSNFVGAPGQPIRFINCGGVVTAGAASGSSGITVGGCRYFTLTGTGDAANFYGIRMTQSNTGSGNNMGIAVGGLSSDCEIDHVEVGAAGFAGIMVKTDPSCDPATWRENFTMYNVSIHDNYVHDTSGEGLYIGNSFYGGGQTVTCAGAQRQIYPHLIYGLELYNNRTERTGCEGIQIGCAPDAKIHDNLVQTAGRSPFANYQNNGVQIGGGTGGDFYNNTVLDSPAAGVIIVGHLGNNRIFNNVISDTGGDGIFCDDRPGTVNGATMQFVNNTIVNSGRDGIRLYDEINVNTVANNAITGYSAQAVTWGYAGRPIVLAQGATSTEVKNFTLIANSSAGYANPAADDFTLTAASPLIRAGVDASAWGVLTDRLGRPRPVGSPYSIGAYEYVEDGAGSGRRGAAQQPSGPDGQARAYPSPCTDRVTIQLPPVRLIRRVEVYAAGGHLMDQWTPHGEPTQTVTLPTGNWSAGTYTYRVYDSDDDLYTGHLLKK